MIIAGTGHRKLNNKYPPSEEWDCVKTKLITVLEKLTVDKVLTGMAIGFDQLLAEVCLELKLPYVACIPFVGQENAWPQKSKDKYKELIKKASEVVACSEGDYASYKMQVRNKYMCDNCDKLIAVWNNNKFGGTYNCIQYAREINKEIIFINPNGE